MTVSLLRALPDPAERSHPAPFVRPYQGVTGPGIVEISQPDAAVVELRFRGAPIDEKLAADRICRDLGLDTDLTAFDRLAQTLPWLRDLATRTRGVRPPRLADSWEAGAHAIIHQSVSMLAAGALLRRFVTALGDRVVVEDTAIQGFPTPHKLLFASGAQLRAIGLSGAKSAALQALAHAVSCSSWDDARLETLPTAQLAAHLTHVRGIGPWSAAVIALRGFGRLDVFPMRDSGVARTIVAMGGPPDPSDALHMLGASRGMLYHLLLLARLEARARSLQKTVVRLDPALNS